MEKNEVSQSNNESNEKTRVRERKPHRATTYIDTLVHLFKGNVGTGCFGMAHAIKNSGLLVGGLLTILIACIVVHMEHILVKSAEYKQGVNKLDKRPSYAKTLELCFAGSRSERIRRLAPFMKSSCNYLICLTQLGFCSVYFVFVSTTLKYIFDFHGYVIDIHLMTVFVFIPIWLTSLVRELKLMVIFSAIANCCMIIGIILTIGFAAQDLPPISERKLFAGFETLPVFFGMVTFAFEGIALVLPLRNQMRYPEKFGGMFGVLNVGMFLVTLCFVVLGEIGYWKYGEETKGSLTFNLPTEDVFAQIVMIMIALGVSLGYTLQLFIAVQILFGKILQSSKLAKLHPDWSEYIFRTLLVIGTFLVAELVPNLSLLLSFVGSVLCSVLAFIYPVIIEFVILDTKGEGIGWAIWMKNIFVLLFAMTGSISGAYVKMEKNKVSQLDSELNEKTRVPERKPHRPTTYIDTLLHLFKGNVGSGCFGMADAIKNSGLLVGGLLTILIACIVVHMEHILIKSAEYVQKVNKLDKRPSYADTLQMCFEGSRSERIRRWAPFMKSSCNFLICLTQLGFCAVYFVFVSTTLKYIFDFHGYVIDIHLMTVFVFIPIWLTSLVRELKLMVIFSALANCCMITGIILTIGFAAQDLPPISERKLFAGFETLPFFFGIAMFAFEGIALVLPLKNAMRRPEKFGGFFGVLNVGMFLVTLCYFVLGEIGYWKYGDETKGSLTLNLPSHNVFAQIVMITIALGVLLGYTLELFIAVQILFGKILESSKLAKLHPDWSEYIFRTLLVIGTFLVAELVPNLTLLLSFVGSVLCSVLAFIYPVIIEFVILDTKGEGIGWAIWMKNIFFLLFSTTGCISGAYVSVREIYGQF